MPILIIFLDNNSSFEVEVEPPVEGKPSTPIIQFPSWHLFLVAIACHYHVIRMHVTLHVAR